MVKRYWASVQYDGNGEAEPYCEEAADGDWVNYADYDALAARLAEAERILREGSQYALAPHSVGQSMLLVQWAEYVESQYGDRDSATSETVGTGNE